MGGAHICLKHIDSSLVVLTNPMENPEECLQFQTVPVKRQRETQARGLATLFEALTRKAVCRQVHKKPIGKEGK